MALGCTGATTSFGTVELQVETGSYLTAHTTKLFNYLRGSLLGGE
jgi:hypothetical protein